jgi:hypothetical protein
MRVLITGGTGLIGSALVNSFTRDQHEVIVLSRSPERQAPTGVRLVGWDGHTTEGWGGLVNEVDAIINLAGESIGGDSIPALITKRWTSHRKKLILQSRLDGGKALTDAVRAATKKPDVFIQASAVGYYGSRGDEVLTEDSRPGSTFDSGVCQAWENSTSEVEHMGVRRVVIRTAGVAMSTGGGALPFMLLPFKLFAGGRLGTGRQWFSWIHMADEVGAIRFLIENPTASGVFNLSAPEPVKNADFSRILGRVMNRPSFLPVPEFALRLALGEKSEMVLGSQKQLPIRLQQLGYKFRFPRVEEALRDLLSQNPS